MPNAAEGGSDDFISGFLYALLQKTKSALGDIYPAVFIILGNDDTAVIEDEMIVLEAAGLFKYINCRMISFGGYKVFGYNYVPPTPFMLKDWEKYDVSRYLDPGDVSPEEGYRTVPVPHNSIKFSTIANDLDELAGDNDMSDSLWLFHSPPHDTMLDRAANDGVSIEHVQLPLNVGSIAIRRFIEKRRPLVTLHGHIHESARLTGSWREKLGATHCFNASHDGKGLSLIKFDTSDLENAVRVVV
jgi:Icc-related predicted phosphoesterase